MALRNLHKHLMCAFHPAVLSRATLLLVDLYSVSSEHFLLNCFNPHNQTIRVERVVFFSPQHKFPFPKEMHLA